MTFPSIVSKNQFGEQSNSLIIGGTSQINCNFVVDVANGNGLGVRSLKGLGVANVFMHSTAAFTGTSHTSTLIDSIAGGTASLVVGMPVQGSGIAAGSKIASIVDSGSITLTLATSTSTTGSITYQGVGSPNPATGYIAVQLSKAHAGYQNGTFGFVSPLSGSSVNISSGLTANAAYTIVSVGTSTAANWQAIGLAPGITPTVGATFFASTSSAGTGTGAVQLILATGSTVDHLEVVGDPNQTCNPSDGTGSSFILVSLGATNSSTTTFIAKAPADNTVIGLTFNMLRNPLPLI